VCVATVLLFGSECWVLHSDERRALHRVWFSFVRQALGVKFTAGGAWHMTNEQAVKQLGVPSAQTLLSRRFAQWIGHVARMPATRLPRAALFGTVPDRISLQGTETAGWRKGRYPTQVAKCINLIPGVDERTWATQAQDKEWWRKAVRGINAAIPAGNTHDELTCPLCGQTAKDAKGLRHHINLRHGTGDRPQHACSECNRMYVKKGDLLRHLSTVHGHAAAPAAPLIHECRYCRKMFALVGTRNAHEQHYCPQRPGSGAVVDGAGNIVWKCRNCREVYQTKRALSIHLSHQPACKAKAKPKAAPKARQIRGC
jgi:uncharacterized C2H2 Zn-finger protein